MRNAEPAPDTGALLFARYAYPPSALGYCGPPQSASLLRAAGAARDPKVLGEVVRTAAGFEGAWPYLELLAAHNAVAGPLDRRVVEAYWIGNPLVDNLPPITLAERLREEFSPPSGALAAVVGDIPAAGVAHHSFHVFFVYPWLRMAHRGVAEPAAHILDQCRIRWGVVESAGVGTAQVRSRRLVLDDGKLALGDERTETVRPSLDGSPPAVAAEAGDVVSMHWDRICDRLEPGEAEWLEECTRRNIEVANSLPAA